MNKRSLTVAGFTILAGSLLAGCASITDQIANKVAETAVNQATGGKVSVDSGAGTMTLKDDKGNVAQIGGGTDRPASAPVDMPSLPGATGYSWIGAKEGGYLSFTVPGTDYKALCDNETTLIKAAGWADSKNGFNMEIGGTKTTMYEKTGFTMTISCSNDGESKDTVFVLTKTAGNQTSADGGTAAMMDGAASDVSGALKDAGAAMKDAGSAVKDARAAMKDAGVTVGN